jgi:hypothetical protein
MRDLINSDGRRESWLNVTDHSRALDNEGVEAGFLGEGLQTVCRDTPIYCVSAVIPKWLKTDPYCVPIIPCRRKIPVADR